ncbi:MAG: hypothetical protein M0029_01880 [Actinomycetota bacterium]|jgi:hypothetical protein|nr:hypothetical protein [Actinomycetota bacterium]
MSATGRDRAVLVADFVHLDLDAVDVGRRLVDEGGSWLAELAARLVSDEDEPLRVGPGGGLAKAVRVTTGEPRLHGDTVVVPVRWEATGPTGLFPRLDADLELSTLGPSRCRLGLNGRYVVPFGSVGKAADRLMLHRIAEGTFRRFLTGLASRLTAPEDGSEPEDGAEAEEGGPPGAPSGPVSS